MFIARTFLLLDLMLVCFFLNTLRPFAGPFASCETHLGLQVSPRGRWPPQRYDVTGSIPGANGLSDQT